MPPPSDRNATGMIPRFMYFASPADGRDAPLKSWSALERAGTRGCVLVEGGTQAWIDAGLPVNRGQSRVLPLMRQVQIVVGSLSAAGALLALTVNPLFALLPLVIGSGLLFAGLTGFCGLALLLAKMPWNKTAAGNSSSCATTAK